MQGTVVSAHYGKVRKYKERCANEGITFTPWQWKLLEAGTLLAWSITRLGRQLARNFCRKEPITL